MTPPRYLSQFDSTTAMVRALARFLYGRDNRGLGFGRPVELVARHANALSPRARERLGALGAIAEGVPPRRLSRASGDHLAAWATNQYPDRDYPAVAIGSSNGAAVHLCAALGIPWLPQTFLLPMRVRGQHPDEPLEAMHRGMTPGMALTANNPDLQLHHMHDANQDRLRLTHMTYFRVKRRALGGAYERFIGERVPPGGTLVVIECRRRWPTTQVANRYVFQHGAVGGATEDEYLHGGPRVAHYLERHGSPHRRWHGPCPDGDSPEAEWGFEPALESDLQRIARERHYQLRRIVFEDPSGLSTLVADLYRWWYARRGIPGRRLLVESFMLMEPYWALRTGSVPYWMTFNKEPSAAALEHYLDERDPFHEIGLMLFSHGVRSIGLPPMQRWRSILERVPRGRFVAIDEQEFPLDFASIGRVTDDVRSIPARYPLPGYLDLREFDQFLLETPHRYATRIDQLA